MLTAAVAGVGRCFGWQPAAKVSMMIMRPPQHWQGRGSMRGSSEAVASDEPADKDAEEKVRAFLAAHLGGTSPGEPKVKLGPCGPTSLTAARQLADWLTSPEGQA